MSLAGVALSPIQNLDGPIISPDFVNSKLSPPSDESILVYLSHSGSMLPMCVLESDSIEFMKLRIQSCKGYVVKNQKLVCGGRELARSNSLVRDYGITDGNVLHLVLRLSDLQVIKVRTTSAKEFTLHVERGRDVGYVKQQIAKKEKEFDDLDEQEVVCDGEPIEDQRVIDDLCKDHSNAVIHLFMRKSVKLPRPVEKNFELSIIAPRTSDGQSVVRQCNTGGENKKRDYEYDVQKENHRRDYNVVPRKPPHRDTLLEPIIVNPKAELPSVIWEMVNATYDGLDGGNVPIRSMEGTGGAYFMQDSCGHKFVSVFKPMDEEPMAVNNPRRLPLSPSGEGLKKGTRVGEGAFREVAAYILDHPRNGRRSLFGDEKGFAGVPPTVMVKCLHKGFNHQEGLAVKIGSLQQFMDNNGTCEDLGPAAFPLKEVHKISVLDIRMANADRHGGYILLSRNVENGQTMLIPIDHGYCLPETFEDCTFDWLHWPQARQPYDSETIDYIKLLDAEEDITLLKLHGWDVPIECARTLRISTMLLKKGVERGLSAFDIGIMMCRETLNKESIIEEIIQEVQDSALPCSSEAEFLETVSCIMDRRLNEIGKPLY